MSSCFKILHRRNFSLPHEFLSTSFQWKSIIISSSVGDWKVLKPQVCYFSSRMLVRQSRLMPSIGHVFTLMMVFRRYSFIARRQSTWCGLGNLINDPSVKHIFQARSSTSQLLSHVFSDTHTNLPRSVLLFIKGDDSALGTLWSQLSCDST